MVLLFMVFEKVNHHFHVFSSVFSIPDVSPANYPLPLNIVHFRSAEPKLGILGRFKLPNDTQYTESEWKICFSSK